MSVHGLRAPGQSPASDVAAGEAQKLAVARKFEAVLVRQLVSVMRKTAESGGLMGSEGASGQYMSMFDEAVADKIAEGGGVGLASVLMRAFGDGPPQSLPAELNLPIQSVSSGAASVATRAASGGLSGPDAKPLPGLRGATAKLAHAAYRLTAAQGGKQWAREGALSRADLTSQIATAAEGGEARFNVRDAQGYEGAYKCNLFALEAARRAGFQVPVVARRHGWGYPASNAVTRDAEDGSLRAGWATVVQGKDQLAEVRGQLERGELALLLTGAGDGGRHGHMAVVERIHRVALDGQGEIRSIEFDGYEARVDGAEHLERRTWNREGAERDVRGARNGFEQVELLALKPAADGQLPEIKASSDAPRSLKDFF